MCLELRRESRAAGEQRDSREAIGSPEHWVEWEEQARPWRSETEREEPRMSLQMWAVPWKSKTACKTPSRDKAEGVLVEKASGVRK